MEPSFGVGIVQQGPMPPMARALELLIDRGREIHHDAAPGEQPAIVLLDHCAAPGREHDGLQARQALYGFLLPAPEARLSLLLEYERDIHAGSCLDVGIAVVKGESQHAREMAAHGGLSGAHGADEEDVALEEHGFAAYRNEAAARRRPLGLS